MRNPRLLWVVIHRWAGLTIAVFLVIAGLTGSLMPFEESLNFATRPGAARTAPPRPDARPLDGVTIAESIEQSLGVVVSYVPLHIAADHPVRLFVEAKPHAPALPYDVVWADPFTGAAKLHYKWGGVSDGPENIMPFLYSLHYGYVFGTWGMLVFGIAALVWTLDCFVGFYLTLPRRPQQDVRQTPAQWWQRWRGAWKLRGKVGHKLTFDLHRAGGLWLWPILLVFAWSAVCLDLPQVAKPVMKLMGASKEFAAPALAQPLLQPAVSLREAATRGAQELTALGARAGFSVERSEGISYDASTGVYRYAARTSLDPSDKYGETVLWLDGATGRALHFDPPTGATRADGFVVWINMLHMAEVFGLPYRIFVTVLGLGVTVLSVTGVLIWTRRRSARLLSAQREVGVAVEGVGRS